MIQHPVPGTRSISRAIEVAKTVAEHKHIGWRLTDLAARCGLEKSTTYRILNNLVLEQIVQKRSSDRRYIPGPLMFELSLCTPAYPAFIAALHPVLTRLARSGASAHLYLRSGSEVVCVDDVPNPDAQQLTTKGRRLPIEQSTYGIAMLIAMHKDEQQDVLRIAETRGATRNKNLGAYRKVLAQARSAGYAINAGQVVPGLTSIAVAVVDTQGQPFAAIGVVGPDTVLRGAKIERMVEVLRHAAQQISEDHAELIGELRP